MAGGPGLQKRRIGESILYNEGEYYKFNVLNKKQSAVLNKQICT